jgi:phosphotransferase system HPr (HPr) family protein
MKVLEQDVTVTNQRGVHSRVATGLAMIAREHGVELQIIHGAQRIDSTSILDVLSMALVCGSRLKLRVQGVAAAAELALAAAQRILTDQDEP